MTAQPDPNCSNVPQTLGSWQLRATIPCHSNRDAKERLGAALGILGADEEDGEEEPGLPEHQGTIEALIRSVMRYLNG